MEHSSIKIMTDEEFEALRTDGTKINYWVICRRKAWLYAKGLRMEQFSDRVSLGRLLHEHSYTDMSRKELLIDDLIKIDIIGAEGKVLEVKYSRKYADAGRLQVAYYLYYLKRMGITGLSGELRFPKERRKEEVELTQELEAKVINALRDIHAIVEQDIPPQAEFMPLCRACAYGELCWA